MPRNPDVLPVFELTGQERFVRNLPLDPTRSLFSRLSRSGSRRIEVDGFETSTKVFINPLTSKESAKMVRSPFHGGGMILINESNRSSES